MVYLGWAHQGDGRVAGKRVGEMRNGGNNHNELAGKISTRFRQASRFLAGIR